MELITEKSQTILQRIKASLKAYAGLMRNVLFLLVKYQKPSAALNSFFALFVQFYCDILNMFSMRKRVRCNICGWKGRTFYPERAMSNAGRRLICPICESFPRQRFLAYNLYKLREKSISDVRVLHVAPEKMLGDLVTTILGEGYTSIDIELARNPLVVCDLTRLSFCQESFDIVLCFAVLEHIRDDGRAIAEIYKTIKPGGQALITVPQKLELEETIEREEPDPLDYNHFRIYGRDFIRRLEKPGFQVDILSSAKLEDRNSTEELRLEKTLIYRAKKLAAKS